MISRAPLALSIWICRIIPIAFIIGNCGPVYSLNPDYPLSKYIHTSWGSEYGLGSLRQLAQTPDGYLWFTTSSGLVRFDGVSFTKYARADGQSLDNSNSLLVDPDGSLWVATFGGVVAHFQSGKFHSYTSRDGLPSDYIQALYRNSQGVLWAGTRGHGIFRMVHGRFEKLSLDIPSTAIIMGFLEDSDHSLWIATFGNGVFRLQNGHLRAFSVKDGLPDARVSSLYRDHFGKTWTVGVNGISVWNGTRFVGQPAVNSVVRFGTQSTEDRDGNLWIAASSGLFRVRAGRVTKMDASSGLSSDYVVDVYEDKEGNIWAATIAGLDRLRDAQVRTFTKRDGLLTETAALMWPIVADRSAGVWSASERQVVRIAANRITAWPMALPSLAAPHTMLFEPDSSFLLGSDRGLEYWSPAHAALAPEMDGLDVRCLLQARDGSVWIGTANRGLLHWKSYPRPEKGLDAVIPDNFISTLAEERDGTIWAGSHGGGLYRIAARQVQHFGQAEGLRTSNVYTVFVDHKGALWIGTSGGLSWFQDGRICTVNSEEGLHSDLVLAILDDSWDQLWFLTHAEVAAIDKKSLTELAAGRRPKLNPTYYRSADGLADWTVDRTFPNAAQSVDGHLWFAVWGGIAEITPPNPRLSHKLEFPVVVEDVTIDGISDSEPNRIQIRPGAHSVEIRYTALTLSSPDAIQFRYRLEGIDDDWVDADTRRIAFYNKLKPRTYTFRVEASAGGDQWLESSPLLLEQMPFFYQTKSFLFLVSTAALLIIFLVYRLRMRRAVDLIKAGFQQRMDERTRIARELHDTLLQSFNALLLRLQTVSNVLPASPDEAKRRIDGAIEQASDAITEGRDAVQELRSGAVATMDLDQAITSFAKELRSGSTAEPPPEIHIEIQGKPRHLNPEARDEVFRIAAEALRNAIRHAHARRIEVEILYDDHQLELGIRDDGKGIDPGILGDGRSLGHWGLHGMRERAEIVGGTLEVRSQVSVGTEIAVKIPAANIYAKPTSARWPFSRFRHS